MIDSRIVNSVDKETLAGSQKYLNRYLQNSKTKKIEETRLKLVLGASQVVKVIIIIGIVAAIVWYFGFYQSSIPITQSFKDGLSEINEQFDNTKMKFDKGVLDEKTYRKTLENLLAKQEKLYSDAENHIWSKSQISESSSWVRGIMKSPNT